MAKMLVLVLGVLGVEAFVSPVTTTHRAAVLRPLSSTVVDKKEEAKAKVAATPAVVKPGIPPKQIEYPEVRAALKAWTDGIIEIGDVFTAGGDYRAKAMEVIESNYAFSHEMGPGNQILFKPTKASEHPFRSQYDEFLSYFVGDGKFSEDQGFALAPWSKIRFDMYGVFITEASATVSGNYWFTNANDGSETKVEYSFQFVRVANPPGKLKIVLHHSSLPFAP